MANDLQRVGKMWSFVVSAGVVEEEIKDDNAELMASFKILPSEDIDLDEVGQKSMFIIFLTNVTPNRRIWKVLHMPQNSKLIQKTSQRRIFPSFFPSLTSGFFCLFRTLQ